MTYVTIERDGRIVTLTLNNPPVNCLSNELLLELEQVLIDLNNEPVSSFVILTMEDNKRHVWSAGFNVNDLPLDGSSPLYYDDPLERIIRAIIDYKHIVIAKIYGRVFGGAVELVSSCDVVIAAEHTSFQLTPVKLGIPYNLDGIAHIVQKTSNGFARFMLLTASVIDAEWALRVGLVHMIVLEHELDLFTQRFAQTQLVNSSHCVETTKRLMKILDEGDFVAAFSVNSLGAQLRRDTYRHPDYREGLTAIQEKRSAVFPSNGSAN